MSAVTIDYLGHSGFLAETKRHLLLFDYFRGDLSVLDERPADKPLYVFVSHAHGDHFNPEIFRLRESGREVRYILSSDIRRTPEPDIVILEADQTCDIPGLGRVETFLSTDEGVAFLAETDGVSFFHAGDLHWWDWEGEDPGWLAEQESVFKREIEKLAGRRVDAAFAVLDDRLGANFAEGLNWFLSACHPRFVFPMHFWEDRSVVSRFTEQMRPGIKTQIMDTAGETQWKLEI